MAFEGGASGPSPLTVAVELFNMARRTRDSSAITDANLAAAREAGYTRDDYTRAQLVAIGQGLRTDEFREQSQDRDQLNVGPPVIVVAPAPSPPSPEPPPPPPPPPPPLPGPWVPPSTEGEWEEWQEESGTGGVTPNPVEWGWEGYNPPPTGFQQYPDPFPETLPRTLPQTLPLPSLPGVFVRVLGNVLGGILYPNRTADDDVWDGRLPDPEPVPKGPPKRPRVRLPQPYGWPLPDWWARWRKRRRYPGTVYPSPDDDSVYQPQTRPTGNPFPSPGPTPGTRPGPTPGTRPGTVPAPGMPAWPDLLPYLYPFGLPNAVPRPGVRPARPPSINPFGPDPLTPTNPRSVDLPQPFAPPRPANADPCNCSDTKRKRKKSDSCSNPISSKRTFTRGSVRYRTITRKLSCPESSRKKPRLPRVR